MTTTTLVPVRRESRDPWDVGGDLGRVFDSPWELHPRRSLREGLWHPTMDIYNRKDELVVELELPGLKESDLDVSIEEDHLIVEGTRSRFTEYKEEELYFSERSYGGFHRIVHLPTSVDADSAQARFSEGVLTIALPKKVREGGKKIEVTSS